MTKRTYSEVLEAVLEKLDEATLTPGGGAALLARLDAIDRRQQETVTLLAQTNGHIREHGKLLAGHKQWMESHQLMHGALDKRMDHLSVKTNIVAGVNGLMALIAGILGARPDK